MIILQNTMGKKKVVYFYSRNNYLSNNELKNQPLSARFNLCLGFIQVLWESVQGMRHEDKLGNYCS